MKILLTIKTGMGNKSTEKDIDKTVNELMEALAYFEKRGYDSFRCKCCKDGTEAIIEKQEMLT